MNIFDVIEKYRKQAISNKPSCHDADIASTKQKPEDKPKSIFDGLTVYGKGCGKNSKGVYVNEYTSRSYSQMCRDAANLYEDAFDGEPDAMWNID